MIKSLSKTPGVLKKSSHSLVWHERIFNVSTLLSPTSVSFLLYHLLSRKSFCPPEHSRLDAHPRFSNSIQVIPHHGKWKSLSCVWLFVTPWITIVHGILQDRILEWVAYPFSRGSPQPRDRTHVFQFAGGFFTFYATGEAQEYWNGYPIPSPRELTNPGIDLGSPALQVDSLLAELWGKPIPHHRWSLYSMVNAISMSVLPN